MENNTAVLEPETLDIAEDPRDLAEDYPGQYIDGPEQSEPPVVAKTLDFTIVHGWLRGEHAKPFELHATGCKDLRSKQAKQLFSSNIYAPTDAAALAAAGEDYGVDNIHVQPCCQLKRMQAIGRA